MKTVEYLSNNVLLASLNIYPLISMGTVVSTRAQPGLAPEKAFMGITVIKAEAKNQFGAVIPGRVV